MEKLSLPSPYFVSPRSPTCNLCTQQFSLVFTPDVLLSPTFCYSLCCVTSATLHTLNRPCSSSLNLWHLTLSSCLLRKFLMIFSYRYHHPVLAHLSTADLAGCFLFPSILVHLLQPLFQQEFSFHFSSLLSFRSIGSLKIKQIFVLICFAFRTQRFIIASDSTRNFSKSPKLFQTQFT